MNTMKQNKPESVSDINWVLEPGLSEEKSQLTDIELIGWMAMLAMNMKE